VEQDTADYFEASLSETDGGEAAAKLCANWINGELAAALNRDELPMVNTRLAPAQLGELVACILEGAISNAIGKKVFQKLWSGEGESARAIIAAEGWQQINDPSVLEKMVDEVLASNPVNVAEFRAGKTRALNALVGQVMKAAQGKANPQQVNSLLRERLSAEG